MAQLAGSRFRQNRWATGAQDHDPNVTKAAASPDRPGDSQSSAIRRASLDGETTGGHWSGTSSGIISIVRLPRRGTEQGHDLPIPVLLCSSVRTTSFCNSSSGGSLWLVGILRDNSSFEDSSPHTRPSFGRDIASPGLSNGAVAGSRRWGRGRYWGVRRSAPSRPGVAATEAPARVPEAGRSYRREPNLRLGGAGRRSLGAVGGSHVRICADRNVCESTVSRASGVPGVTGSRPGLTVSEDCTETRTRSIESSCSRISCSVLPRAVGRARVLKTDCGHRDTCVPRSSSVTASAVRPARSRSGWSSAPAPFERETGGLPRFPAGQTPRA